MPASSPVFDVCVRGAGPVGRALALTLAHRGLRVALVELERSGGADAVDGRGVAQQDVRGVVREDIRDFAQEDARSFAQEDIRSFALNAGSVRLLQRLKVWDGLLAATGAATAVTEMKVFGDGGGTLAFSAWQQRVRELAWIVDAAALERELAQAVRFAPGVQEVQVAQVLRDEPKAALVALCEGRDSARRSALGVEMATHDYGQTALAARLASDRPHGGTAWQWFRSPDVLALLPTAAPASSQAGAAGGYSLVWSLPAARAAELRALDAPAFEQALNEASGGVAGTLRLASERVAWPLRIAKAPRWHGQAGGVGWVLLGDAAHSVHPLAGQGLNLGLADVQALDAVLAERAAREAWRPLSDPRLLARYARRRLGATAAMSGVTDALQQLFSRDDPISRELRNRGLNLVDHLPAFKRWLGERALQGG